MSASKRDVPATNPKLHTAQSRAYQVAARACMIGSISSRYPVAFNSSKIGSSKIPAISPAIMNIASAKSSRFRRRVYQFETNAMISVTKVISGTVSQKTLLL